MQHFYTYIFIDVNVDGNANVQLPKSEYMDESNGIDNCIFYQIVVAVIKPRVDYIYLYPSGDMFYQATQMCSTIELFVSDVNTLFC